MLETGQPWLPGLLARVAGVALVVWASCGLRRGGLLAGVLVVPLLASGAARLAGEGSVGTVAPASWVEQGLAGALFGLAAAMPLLALTIFGRTLARGWQLAGRRGEAEDAAGARRAGSLAALPLLLGLGTLFAGGGHRPLLTLWLRSLTPAPAGPAVALAARAEQVLGLLGDGLAAGLLLGLPILVAAAGLSLLAGVRWTRPDGDGEGGGGGGVGVVDWLAGAAVLLGLALWAGIGRPGLAPLLERTWGVLAAPPF